MTLNQLNSAWETTCEKLRDILNENTYERWIAGIVPLNVEDHTLLLGVSNETFCDWLNDNYHDLIRDMFEQSTGMGLRSIRFEGGHEPANPVPQAESVIPPIKKEPVPANRPQPSHSGHPISFNVHFTFDTFVVGENNKFAYAAATAVANAPGQSYNPLFIYGPTGLGKTHLLQAVAQNVLQRQRDTKVEYLTSEEFANNFIDALSQKKLTQFRDRFRNVDLLLIDDVHFFGDKERLQEEFFHTFNALSNNHKQIILTSDRPPHEINGLEKRLVSRFEWGLTTEIIVPDIETRIAILRKKQEEQTIRLDPEVLYFIASRIRSNVRRLEGALIRLVSYASMYGVNIDREMATGLLQPILDEESSNALTVHDIQRAVADHYDIRLADMTSKRRPQNIAQPRQIAMHLSRNLTQNSFEQIGLQFNRNHATVVHAVNSVEKKMKEDEHFRNEINRLERTIKNR